MRKSWLRPASSNFLHTSRNVPYRLGEELGSPQNSCAEKENGWSNDASTAFVVLLRTCARSKDLRAGIRIHNDVLKQGLLQQCSDALVTMYAKCGEVAKARELFDLHKSRDVLTWTALIAGYSQEGQGHYALDCLKQLLCEGLSPDAVTFICSLKACGSIRAGDKGEQIHNAIIKRGLLGHDIVLGTALIDMYAKCGNIAKAQQVLDELPMRDVVAWNALIAGCAQEGQAEQALNRFERMKQDGLPPNGVTFISVLKACGTLGTADKGDQIYDEIVRQGMLGDNCALDTALVDMYVKCGALAKARGVLEELSMRNVISWSALIAGYAQQGDGEQALDCFERMQSEGLSPNAVTFSCILKACGSIGAAEAGEKIHDEIAKQGLLGNNIVLGNGLIDMYAKCGALLKAQRVLEELPVRDVVSWSALISGYAQQGQCEQALYCLNRMRDEGLSPNEVTFAGILKACSSIGSAEEGEKIHGEIATQGLLANSTMLGNTLVDMYGKCGALEKAQQVLEELPVRDIVSWNALIAGYIQQGQGEEALDCFQRMQGEGFSPGIVTYICLLKACGSIGAADKGKQIHDDVARLGLLRGDIVLGTALVDMYAKCGALDKAWRMLEELPVRDVVCWNALIAGYAQHGEGEQALNCFELMQHERLSPDAATFSSVLSACNLLGLVEEAQMHFANMITKFGTKPDLEHYSSLTDTFGRSGHLDKAVGVIEKMAYPGVAVWSALLIACWHWEDVCLGRWAFDHAIRADKIDAAVYVLMAHIYMVAGLHEDAQSIEAMRIENKAWEVQNRCHNKAIQRIANLTHNELYKQIEENPMGKRD